MSATNPNDSFVKPIRFPATCSQPKPLFSDIQWGYHYTHGSGIKCIICRNFDL